VPACDVRDLPQLVRRARLARSVCRYAPDSGGRYRARDTTSRCGFALQQHYIPRLLRLRFVRDGEAVDYPLETLAKEREAEEQLVREQQELESPDVGKPAWTCAGCGEENPGNF
jgi:chromosome condensin MukBEF MukE localization factor